jgi:hypothetical protein
MILELIASKIGTGLVVKAGRDLAVMGAEEQIKAFANARKEQKVDAETDRLLEVLSQGKIHPSAVKDSDTFLSIIWRFQKAVSDGAGERNLAMLRQLILGTFKSGEDITASRCNYLQDIIAELSEAEIELVYALYKQTQSDNTHAASAILKKKFVPTPCQTQDHFDAAVARLTRTGLITPITGTFCRTSPLMDELVLLVNEEIWNQTF